MGKPSIFSRDYKKRMRKRRKNIALTCVVVLLAAVTLLTLGSGNIAKWIGKININKWSQSQKNRSANSKDQTKITPGSETNNTKKTEEESKNGYDVALSNGVLIKAVYENSNGIKKFKYIEPVSSDVPYSINPSGSAMVLYDSTAQNIIYVDTNGKNVDLTRKDYTSTHDATVYLKNDVLKNNPNYIWCVSPTFINENNIAYISELPWFNNQSLKYIWIVNTLDASHKQVLTSDGSDTVGQNIKFGNVTDKGLGVTIDNKNYYIKSDGSIVE